MLGMPRRVSPAVTGARSQARPWAATAESGPPAPARRERPEPAALTVGRRRPHSAITEAWVTRRRAPRRLAAPPDLTALTSFPVPDHTSSGFGWRDDPIRHRRQFHAGTDIRAPRGTRVYVAGDGHVIFAGRQHGYGKVVYVDHGGGVVTRYAHLSRIEVHRGDDVAAATEIGRVGSTGRATGPHLHFEVRIDGRPVNPVLAMQVAGLERTDPDLAALLGVALAPACSRAGSMPRTRRATTRTTTTSGTTTRSTAATTCPEPTGGDGGRRWPPTCNRPGMDADAAPRHPLRTGLPDGARLPRVPAPPAASPRAPW